MLQLEINCSISIIKMTKYKVESIRIAKNQDYKLDFFSEGFEWNNISEGLSVITGINGSGKTKLLQHIYKQEKETFLSQANLAILKSQIQTIFATNDNNNSEKITQLIKNVLHKGVLYVKDDGEQEYFNISSIIAEISDNKIQQIKFSHKNGDKFFKNIKPLNYINDIAHSISNRFDFIKYDFNIYFNQESLKKAPKKVQDNAKKIVEIARPIHDMGQAYLPKSQLILNEANKAIMEIFNSRKYQIKSIDFDPEKENPLDKLILQYEDKELPYAELGKGERKMIDLILISLSYNQNLFNLNVLANDHISVLLLDEFDANLNPKLQEDFIKICIYLSQYIQVIITTHSASTVAYAPKENLFWIDDKENGKVTIEQRPQKEILKDLTPGLVLLQDSIDTIIQLIEWIKENQGLMLCEGKDIAYFEKAISFNNILSLQQIKMINCDSASKIPTVFNVINDVVRKVSTEATNNKLVCVFDDDKVETISKITGKGGKAITITGRKTGEKIKIAIECLFYKEYLNQEDNLKDEYKSFIELRGRERDEQSIEIDFQEIYNFYNRFAISDKKGLLEKIEAKINENIVVDFSGFKPILELIKKLIL